MGQPTHAPVEEKGSGTKVTGDNIVEVQKGQDVEYRGNGLTFESHGSKGKSGPSDLKPGIAKSSEEEDKMREKAETYRKREINKMNTRFEEVQEQRQQNEKKSLDSLSRLIS